MRKILLVLSPLLVYAARPDIEQTLQKIRDLASTKISATVEYEIYDPFTPPPTPPKKVEPTVVSKQPLPKIGGVVDDYAFIDGRWVKVGDRVGIYMVVAVARDSVKLAEGGRIYTLQVKLAGKGMNFRKDPAR